MASRSAKRSRCVIRGAGRFASPIHRPADGQDEEFSTLTASEAGRIADLLVPVVAAEIDFIRDQLEQRAALRPGVVLSSEPSHARKAIIEILRIHVLANGRKP